MNLRILQQPFSATGELSRLGADMNQQLLSGEYNDIHIFSAFVTSSGTQRLAPGLRSVTQASGTVRFLIGVNNGLTSLQAVADLHDIGAEVLGLHTGGSVLFHPKVYFLRGPNRAWISIGSSNLTGDGMYRNIETNTVIELDLGLPEDVEICDQLVAWLDRFRTEYPRNRLRITPQSVAGLVNSGILVDEIARAREARVRRAGTLRARNLPMIVPPPITVPSLPASPSQRRIRRRPRPGLPERNELSVPTPSPQTRHFAMVLSAHDASKKTGVKGTPELSLPRSARDFFPSMVLSDRQFPDAYFDVRLNEGQLSRVVEYRIWERPGGEGTGHSDVRINIKHDTVDLTTDGGGDIILFETTPGTNGPSYEVWVISPTSADYAALQQRCTHTVTAQGAGAQKRYGFF